MQSIWRLPWCSEPGGDKAVLDTIKIGTQKPRLLPNTDIATLNKLKRRRADSAEPQSTHIVKKPKVAHQVSQPLITPILPNQSIMNGSMRGAAPPVLPQDESVVEPQQSTPAETPRTAETETPPLQPEQRNPTEATVVSPARPETTASNRTAALRRVLEARLNEEILLKHNELRCIDQELAKCQIALEQLRRCRVIPFPGSEGPSVAVTEGSNPALAPRPGYTLPPHPAPWGVTDGPYTRHYAKWLIPDRAFDPVPEQSLSFAEALPGISEGRVTRGSMADSVFGAKPRSSRASAGNKLNAPTDASGIVRDPLVLRRSTDGQLVKLFCGKCGHSNFSNVQGFLNHCRIQHKQHFLSHDEAAIACGRPVDSDVIGHPSLNLQASAPTTSTPGGSLVHPLIKTPIVKRDVEVYHASTQSPVLLLHQKNHQRNEPPVAQSNSFVASPHTPHLSALLQKRGISTNLQDLVTEAKSKIDLDVMETITSDDDTSSTPHSKPPPTTSRKPALARLPAPLDRSVSRKTHRTIESLVPPSLTSTVDLPRYPAANSRSSEAPESPLEIDLSPHTIDSSNPGLVSDREDDVDEEEEEDTRSEAEQPEEVGEDAFREVRDVMDVDFEDVGELEAERGFGCAGGSSKR